MPSGSTKKGSVKPFNRGSAAVKADSKTVPYGKPAVMLQNIKDAAAQSQGKPKTADIVTVDRKNRNKQQMDNLRQLGDARYGMGDNPFNGPQSKASGAKGAKKGK